MTPGKRQDSRLELVPVLRRIVERAGAALGLTVAVLDGGTGAELITGMLRDRCACSRYARLEHLRLSLAVEYQTCRRTYRGLVGADGAAICADKLVLGRRVVDGAETLLVGAGCIGDLTGATGEEVTADDAKVCEKLADLCVCEDEGEEGAEVLDGLLAV